MTSSTIRHFVKSCAALLLAGALLLTFGRVSLAGRGLPGGAVVSSADSVSVGGGAGGSGEIPPPSKRQSKGTKPKP